MKKLIKTRKLLSELIDEKRLSQEGEPISDFRLFQVSEELEKFENGYSFFKFIAILYLILIAIGSYFSISHLFLS